MTTGEIKGLIEILSLAVPSGKGKGGKEKRDRLEITKQEKKMKKMKRNWLVDREARRALFTDTVPLEPALLESGLKSSAALGLVRFGPSSQLAR